jgi:hypothetical protein
MLRFDRFVYKEMDGRLRLLFEEGSSYIYVWINPGFEILAFQFLISGVTGLQYFETGSVKVNEISRLPFNRALTGATGLSDGEAINHLAKFESKEFPSLVPILVSLAHKKITTAVVSKNERPLITRLLQESL